MKKIELTEKEVRTIHRALEISMLSLSDDIEATKEHPSMKADFEEQLSTIEPMFIKLDNWLDEID